MDSVDVFRQLGGGVRFNKKKYADDIDFFKSATDVVVGSARAQTTPAASLDFFGSLKKQKVQEKRKREDDEDDEQPSEENDENTEEKKNGKNKKKNKNKNKRAKKDKQVAKEAPEEEAKEEEEEEEEQKQQEEEKGDYEDERNQVALFGKSEIRSEGGTKKKKKAAPISSEQQKERERVNNLRHAHKIRVKGGDVPAPITAFAELEASMRAYLLRNIEAAGYTTPTPIQMQSIPILLHGRELMAIAPTGSGKTAAYVLPILSKLKQPEKVGFRAVIVSPTRELAQQIYRELRKLSKGKEFRICVLTKANANENSFSSTTRFDILVTTPMRLVHLLRNESLKLDSVQHLVLDEADKLLDMGFMEQVDEIIAACTNQAVQRSLWSATMSPIVEDLARTFLRDPVHLTIGTRDAATTTIKQRLEFVGREEGKLLMLRQMITQGIKPPVLIFVQSKDRAKELFRELIYENLKVDVIHSERTQAQRDSIIKNFRSGAIWILICTDLMARGIDFRGVSSVINYDFPQTTQEYIHRIGRTGRAGRAGESITFFTEEDVVMIRSIANIMKNSGCDVPEWILNIEKAPRSKRKEIARRPIARRHIETVSTYDLKQGRKLRKEKSKKIKQFKKAGTAGAGGPAATGEKKNKK